MAAIHACLWACLRRGDRLLAAQDLYGGTHALLEKLLPRLEVSCTRVDFRNEEAFERALGGRPSLVYFETPTNPLVRLIGGAEIVTKAHAAGARVVVDNTFATPILQNPLAWGADLVVHSATKYLGGHSDLVLGAVTGRAGERDSLEDVRRTYGAVPDPFAAWILNRGLATLALRVRAQSEGAQRIAEWLAGHRSILQVHYPGLAGDPDHRTAMRQMRGCGGVLSFELPGGREAVTSFLRGLRLIRLATSLGGTETLASHPATSSHLMIPREAREALGIQEGHVRLAVGIEDPADLIADLDGALRTVPPVRSG